MPAAKPIACTTTCMEVNRRRIGVQCRSVALASVPANQLRASTSDTSSADVPASAGTAVAALDTSAGCSSAAYSGAKSNPAAVVCSSPEAVVMSFAALALRFIPAPLMKPGEGQSGGEANGGIHSPIGEDLALARWNEENIAVFQR